jgi:hypothetical protein
MSNAKAIRDLPRLVKVLHEEGVKFLLAGDESTVQRELAAMVRAVLSPYEALLTGRPAGVMIGGRWLSREELDRRLAVSTPE